MKNGAPTLPGQGRNFMQACRKDTADVGRNEYLVSPISIYLMNMAADSAQIGQPFHRKLDTCSAANWTAVPDQTGQSERSDARG